MKRMNRFFVKIRKKWEISRDWFISKISVQPMHWSLFIPGLLFLLTLAAGWRAAFAENNELHITYLNVGQGDSALVRGPDGFDVLIDGGEKNAGPTVAAFLRTQAVDDIDIMLASHNDDDHIGGLVYVLEITDIPVAQVLYNGYPKDSDIFREFATSAAIEGAELQPAQFPTSYTWGVLTAKILNPLPGLTGTVDQNNASILVLIEYGNQKFLFTGDIEDQAEAQVLLRGTPVAAQVLKIAHHGSDSSSSADFLDAVHPTDAVISVGKNNPYDHPDQEVLDRLQAAGIQTWRTDINGNIVIVSDGTGYTIDAQYTNWVFLPFNNRGILSGQPVGRIEIRTIFYDGVVSAQEPDEYVAIANLENFPVEITGWTVRDQDDKVFTFPHYVLAPGQECWVYTNESHAEWCGFNWGRSSPVWDNDGECGFLQEATGATIDDYCYP